MTESATGHTGSKMAGRPVNVQGACNERRWICGRQPARDWRIKNPGRHRAERRTAEWSRSVLCGFCGFFHQVTMLKGPIRQVTGRNAWSRR
ncbi:hypothetical protein NDU88_003838 [Pleurodeles waltl]|uniref:Uncharacterized protein n=1 Tax=Pleurodeles waltl TaxID=8319 RepID=A0AAV7VFD3_PLEWA|nr:hypothetical protein NDU88_003838 [Pleurodeles waltl]